jgi:hypothetical protein
MPTTPDIDPQDPGFIQEIFQDPDKLDTYFESVATDLDEMSTILSDSFADSQGPQQTFPGLDQEPAPLDFSRLMPAPDYQPASIPKPAKPIPEQASEEEKETPLPAEPITPTPLAKKESVQPSISVLAEPPPTPPTPVVHRTAAPPKKKGILLKGFQKKEKAPVKSTAKKADKLPPKKDKKVTKETPKDLTTHADIAKKLKEREQRIQDLLDPNRGGTSI